MRTLGYARVSSAEQALGTSLQDQQEVIRAYAAKRGLKVERMYVEAESAVYEKAERRDQVQALLADVKRGDLVLVDKIDRWSRDPEFSYGSIRKIIEKGAKFFAIGDDCDPSTHQGDSMLGMRVFFAREEHKRIRLRMVGTRKLLRDRGYYSEGLPPWGYRRQDVKGPERNVLVIDEAEAERVRQVFALCRDGDSLRQIAEKVDDTKDRVVGALKNRIYLGEARDASGTWSKGKHAAIIGARLFADAQAALERRRWTARASHPGSQTESWWLRNIARCGACGAKMSAAYGGPREARRYYYACYARCTRRFVPVRAVESLAEDVVSARLVELRAELATAAAPASPAVDLAAIEEKRERLQRKRARYLEAFADGAMTRQELHDAIARIDVDRTKLDALAQVPEPITPLQRKAVLADVRQMQKAWGKLTPTERREVVAFLARSAALAPDVAPTFDWYSAEDLTRRG